MEIRIEKIKEEDLERARQFCLGIFEEMGWPKEFTYGLENLKEFFGGSREVFFIAKFREKIIGCAGLKKISKEEGLMKRFYVAKEFRGRSLAQKILERIKQFAREKGYKVVFLDIFQDNERAKRFFQKRGFSLFNPSPQENWPETKYPELLEFRKLEL